MDRETTTNKSPGQLSTKLHLKPKLYIPSTLNIDSYTYRVLPTIQMKLILLCVWKERAILARGKTALKFKYEI